MTLPAITPDTLVTRVGNVTFIELDNELIMLNVQTSKYYGIQDVGKSIWDLLGDVPVKTRSIIAQLLEMYDVDEQTCTRQVLNFLEQLRSQELIQVSS